MKRFHKNDRIALIVKTLTENPKKIFTLNYFADQLSCAKSTLSEDIDYIKKIFVDFELGEIETIAGAAGGIQFKPTITKEEANEFCHKLCEKMRESERILTGGYIYMNDILYNPEWTNKIARIFATPYFNTEIDYVVTIETKGIPIAMATARVLNVPVVVVRKASKLTEGTTIHMNYVTSSGRIQTMALAKRAIEKGSKVLFVDDFMRAGGTAKGIIDLMKEFEAEVVGVSFVLETATPENKIIDNYRALAKLESINFEAQIIEINPSEKLLI